MRTFLDQAKQDEFRFKRSLRHAVPDKTAFCIKLRVKAGHPEKASAPVVEHGIEGLDVMSQPVRPVERRSCEAGTMCHRLA
jgi:hypothetical protein